jgi:hypothetical protein
MGNHLYEENKRLKFDNEHLRVELNAANRRAGEVRDGDVVLDAIAAFFKGDAFLEVVPGNVGNLIRFRLEKKD